MIRQCILVKSAQEHLGAERPRLHRVQGSGTEQLYCYSVGSFFIHVVRFRLDRGEDGT